MEEVNFLVSNLSEGEEQVKQSFKESIGSLLDSSSVCTQSTLFAYVKMVCYLFKKNKSFQDFVDLLEESLETQVEKYKNALHGTQNRSILVATYKRRSFETCLTAGKEVLKFFENVVKKTYKTDPTYLFLQFMYPAQVAALENVFESFVCPNKTLASNRTYFRFKIDYRLGLRSQPKEVFDLISADLPATLIGPIEAEIDLETKLLDYYKSEPLIPRSKMVAFLELKTEYIYGVEEDASPGVSPRRSSRVVSTPSKSTTPSKSAAPNKTARSKKRKSSDKSKPTVEIEDSSEDEFDNGKDAQCDVGAEAQNSSSIQTADAAQDDKDAQCDVGAEAQNSSSIQTADAGEPIVVEVSEIAKQFTETTKFQMAKVLLSTEDWLHFVTEICKVIHAQDNNSIRSLLKLNVAEDEKDNVAEFGERCDDMVEVEKEGDKMVCSAEGGEECELEPYPLDKVLTNINSSVCSWTRPDSEHIKGLDCFSECSNPNLFGIYVRAFSLLIFPSKFPHPRVNTVKKLLFDLSRNQNAAARIMPELDALHYRLGSIEFPSTKDDFLVSINSVIQSAIDSGSLKFTAVNAAPNSSLYRLCDSVLFSILVQKPAGMRVVPEFTIPLSFPVLIQEKTFVLQTVAANLERNKKTTYMRSTVCRATINCGGYFLTTKIDGENSHRVTPLFPDKSHAPFKSRVKSGNWTYDLEELFFIETHTQSFAKESFMLEEEYVFECPSLCFVKGADLRRLQQNLYMESNILEAVVELLKQRVKRLSLPEPRKVRNIIFPAQFWTTLTQVETLEELHQCNSAFHLSQYDWNADTIVHLIMFYPEEHWQYCTLDFAQKKVYVNDSNMASDVTSDALEGRNEQIRKFLRFVQEFSGLTGDWEIIECIVPQQTEKILHFCGTHVTINLLRAYAEGLSENPFQEVPSWKSSTPGHPDCINIPIPILNAAKQLMADAILGRGDIFDLFYLLLPRMKLPQERRNRSSSLFAQLNWTSFKRNESHEKSLNLTSVRDLNFFELT